MITLSRHKVISVLLALFVSALLYLRLTTLQGNFSYDALAYIDIFRAFDLVGSGNNNSFNFPYIYASGVVPVEFGFFFLYKSVQYFTGNHATSFAIIASFSVFLRIYLLNRLRVPKLVMVLVSLISISLFEANALRLGISASFLLLGLYLLSSQKMAQAMTVFAASASCHMQAIIFIFPFLTFYVFSSWVTASRARLIFFFVTSAVGSLGISSLLPAVANDKVQYYISVGGSGSAGITITSVVAALFIAATLLEKSRVNGDNEFVRIWSSTAAATVPSVAMLILLTDVAVLGDRSWQLAFTVVVPCYFYYWRKNPIDVHRPSCVFICGLILVVATNILIRFPLSNLFVPILPGI